MLQTFGVFMSVAGPFVVPGRNLVWAANSYVGKYLPIDTA
jgi:hypothetical protein